MSHTTGETTPTAPTINNAPQTDFRTPRIKNQKQKGQTGSKKPNPSSSTKLRGLEKDPPQVRVSKTLSWLLRHGAQGEGLAIRKDGYVKVDDVLDHPKFKGQSIDLEILQEMVEVDSKRRYDMVFEGSSSTGSTTTAMGPSAPSETNPPSGIWWIKANQGHSLKMVQLDLKSINSVNDIPTGIAVHGTRQDAWKSIESQGLSKMTRNHIHLAQGVAGQNIVSGMRNSSQILIFINVQKALDAGIKFYLSNNGVVLTEGDSTGFLKPEFFSRVENSKREALPGWEGSEPFASTSSSAPAAELASAITDESELGTAQGGYETPPAYKAIDKPPHSAFEDLKLE